MSSQSIDPQKLGPEYTAELKAMLDRARAGVAERHRKVSGLENAIRYSDELRDLLVYHMEQASERLGCPEMAESMCLMAVGGFGRYEMGLHSDLDFCFITTATPTAREEEFIKAVLYPLWDLKVDLGYGVFSMRECLKSIGDDFHRATSLLEIRFLWGDAELAEELNERVQSKIRTKYKQWFVDSLYEESKLRHRQSGGTVFLLEPDVKNTCGGLRDVHQVLWLAYAMCGAAELDLLVENGVMGEEERVALLEAWSYLVDLRNSMHLAENRRIDKLTLERQIQVAEKMGVESTETALAEEVLMREYYNRAIEIEKVSSRLMDMTLRRTPGTPQYAQESEPPERVDGDFWRRGDRIWVESRDLQNLQLDPFWPFRLFLAAARERVTPTDETLRYVETFLPRIDERVLRSPVARDLFLSLMGTFGSLADTLRAMNRCGFLSAYLPEFASVRNLPKLDHYHQYTVDEHLIRAVGVAEDLQEEEVTGTMKHASKVARQILRLDLLHLALLIHDVGKGEGRAHVIRGAHAAQRIGERINLRPIEREILRLLVAHHQKMTHMAMRRDIEDPTLAEEMAEAVRTPEILRMLYVHSVSDLTAVAQDAWNDWRGKLMATLYERTLDVLRGIRETSDLDQPANEFFEKIWEAVQKFPEAAEQRKERLDHFFQDMPDRYLRSVTPADAARHFLLSTQITGAERIVFRIDEYENSDYVEITFAAGDAPGLFSNLCGALAAKNFNILSAQVYTAKSGEVIDVFQVQVPPAFRPSLGDVLQRICDRLHKMLETGQKIHWSGTIAKDAVQPITEDRLNMRPPRIDINNESSPTHTVVEIRAPDCSGLLSTITSTFDDLGLNIDLAFIATEAYQVVDVFYVTDLEANRITEDSKLKQLRETMLKRIHDMIEV